MTNPPRNDAVKIERAQVAPGSQPGASWGDIQNPSDIAPVYVPHEALVQMHLALNARVGEIERRCARIEKRMKRGKRNANGR